MTSTWSDVNAIAKGEAMRRKPTWWWELEGWLLVLLTGLVVPGCVLSVPMLRLVLGVCMLVGFVSEQFVCEITVSLVSAFFLKPAESSLSESLIYFSFLLL